MLLLTGIPSESQPNPAYPTVATPFDLRELIEEKVGHSTDDAFGELCAFVERLSRYYSHAIQRAALTPLLPRNTELTIMER